MTGHGNRETMSSSDEADEWEDLGGDDDNNRTQDEKQMDDDDDYEHDEQDDEDDEQDDDDLSWFQELRKSWKQHCVAVLVSILATAAAHTYQRQQQQTTRGSLHNVAVYPQHPSPSSSVTTNNGIGSAPSRFSIDSSSRPALDAHHFPHEHLQDYERTANVSFCGGGMDVPFHNERLAVMDFHFPVDVIAAIQLHYQADIAQDDDYSSLLQSFQHQDIEHPHLLCIQQARDKAETRRTFIRGYTYFVKEPTIESMYPSHSLETPDSVMKKNTEKIQAAHLSFTGFAAKFFNLSPQSVSLYWDGKGGHRNSRRLVGEIPPFESLGTATTPAQSFYVSPTYDADHALERWILTADDAVVYYDPLSKSSPSSHATSAMSRRLLLSPEEEWLYQMQKLNQEFAKHYLINSGRTWLSHFPRAFSLHPIWEANYFGQVHTVFDDNGGTPTSIKLKVESVTPKVFSIQNFLSNDECDALIQMALDKGMQGSTVYSGSLAEQQRDTSTRSSKNTWLTRNTAALTERIYRRAAVALQMDEGLFQKPVDDEVHAHYHSIAESLQVIHYKEGEEYTAHHDFVYPSQRHRYQPTRFATLLLYLNDDYTGGETVFPRAVTMDKHDGVQIKPRKGLGVLFYSVLEDGNMDDRSQHASEPVLSGEKFAANLWIWEPLIN